MEDIYTKPNKYGYKYNINHPLIRVHYEKFKKKYNILIPSDAERKQFEDAIDKFINEKRRMKND